MDFNFRRIKSAFSETLGRNYVRAEEIEPLLKKINDDLYNLTILLKRYLMYIQETTHIDSDETISQNINDFDYVISYNYTNTIERLYKNDETEYYYVHGSLKDESTMVFGCELDEIINGLDITYLLLPFQKHYQRITKKTGNRYYEWIENGNVDFAYFYGFAFSEMDKSTIINIYNKVNVLYIQYYDQKGLCDIVSNLSKYIDKEELISSTNKGKIVFVNSMKDEQLINRIETRAFDEGFMDAN